MKKKILCIEDDYDLAQMVKRYMEREQYDVQIVSNGAQAMDVFQRFHPDLVVLDLMLPQLSGLEIMRQLRQISTVAIIITSAKETETDKVLGLGLGADDYITKPFSMKELIARIDAMFRRIDFLASSQKQNEIAYNDILIRCTARVVMKADVPIPLTMKEFDLLLFLARHPQQVFSKEQIYDHVWAMQCYGDLNTITIHVQKIREKLGDTHGITTIRGVGYRFDGISR